jgi:hypothetical protein
MAARDVRRVRRTKIVTIRPLVGDFVEQVGHPLVVQRGDLMERAPKLILQADARLLTAKMDRALADDGDPDCRCRIARTWRDSR